VALREEIRESLVNIHLEDQDEEITLRWVLEILRGG
jgi:hypothetical protein